MPVGEHARRDVGGRTAILVAVNGDRGLVVYTDGGSRSRERVADNWRKVVGGSRSRERVADNWRKVVAPPGRGGVRASTTGGVRGDLHVTTGFRVPDIVVDRDDEGFSGVPLRGVTFIRTEPGGVYETLLGTDTFMPLGEIARILGGVYDE